MREGPKEKKKGLVAGRSIEYAEAKKVCEEKITLSHLRNDRYSSQNQLGNVAQIVKDAKEKEKRAETCEKRAKTQDRQIKGKMTL